MNDAQLNEIKPNYFIIPLLAVVVAFIGKYYSGPHLMEFDMSWCLRNVIMPAGVPSAWFFCMVWQVIFVLTTAAAILVWNNFKELNCFKHIMGLFCIAAVSSSLWSYFSCYRHDFGLSAINTAIMAASACALVWYTSCRSRLVAVLLFPFAVWSLYSLYLKIMIWQLN